MSWRRNDNDGVAILASIIHRRETTMPDLKKELAEMGLPMRMNW